METTNWRQIQSTNAKLHCVPYNLVPYIYGDLEQRQANPNAVDFVDKFCIDMPGMIFNGRPWEEFVLDGLIIMIPSSDISCFIAAVTALPKRNINGYEHYKLHGFHRCLVLTPEQRDQMLVMLKDREQEAEYNYRDFLKEHTRRLANKS